MGFFVGYRMVSFSQAVRVTWRLSQVLVFDVPAFGTTILFRFVSTTTFLERPWLKLCLTLLALGPLRTPKVFFPSFSLISTFHPFEKNFDLLRPAVL